MRRTPVCWGPATHVCGAGWWASPQPLWDGGEISHNSACTDLHNRDTCDERGDPRRGVFPTIHTGTSAIFVSVPPLVACPCWRNTIQSVQSWGVSLWRCSVSCLPEGLKPSDSRLKHPTAAAAPASRVACSLVAATQAPSMRADSTAEHVTGRRLGVVAGDCTCVDASLVISVSQLAPPHLERTSQPKPARQDSRWCNALGSLVGRGPLPGTVCTVLRRPRIQHPDIDVGISRSARHSISTPKKKRTASPHPNKKLSLRLSPALLREGQCGK